MERMGRTHLKKKHTQKPRTIPALDTFPFMYCLSIYIYLELEYLFQSATKTPMYFNMLMDLAMFSDLMTQKT